MKTMFCKDCKFYKLKKTFSKGQSAGYCSKMQTTHKLGGYKIGNVFFMEVGRLEMCYIDGFQPKENDHAE